MKVNVLLRIGEKVGWTFVQAFLVALLAVNQLDWSYTQAAIASGVAAVITLALASLDSAVIPLGLPFYTDLGLRVARSAAAAFLSYLLVDPTAVLQGNTWQGAVGAAGMAVLVAVKSGGARFFGDKRTAATLPADGRGTVIEIEGYSPNDDDPDAPREPGDLPEWLVDGDDDLRIS